ncbi:neutral zinc metallopeptidase [Arenimonas sp.]|nr:neutral zinc metallopeptidase [Candidatus Parcubacteria bacterium]
MANWDQIESRGNVEDRRGLGNTARIGGGVSLVGIALILLFNYANGGTISDALPQIEEQLQVSEQKNFNSKDFEGADKYEVFTSTVLGSINDMWTDIFKKNNLVYIPPKLVLFRGNTQSACGGASSAVGPHYCPLDKTIYIDETFFEQLQKQYKAKGGDVAEAYVIAHEVGHHVQQQFGLSEAKDNKTSIKTELQADCYAGLWAYSIKDAGVFGVNEIQEALDAAAAVGDDRIQKTTTGRVTPESWTHGSSVERVRWFTEGYTTGSISACDTFK